MSICPKCGGEIRFKLSNLFKWSWWNEKTIEVGEHWHDWMAPRWYGYVVVPLAYLIMLGMIIWVCYDCYKISHAPKAPQEVEAPR